MRFLFIFSIATILLFSCSKEEKQMVNIDYVTLVNEYNNAINKNTGDIPAFAIKGEVVSQKVIIKHKSEVLEIYLKGKNLITNQNESVKFLITLDQKIDVLENIKDAEILYYNNNIIFTDKENNSQINYFVNVTEETLNLFPEINTIKVPGIGFMIDKSFTNLILRSAEGCDCYCEKCESGGDCGDVSCSCTSQCGGGCSKTCRTHYNAICKDNCHQQ